MQQLISRGNIFPSPPFQSLKLITCHQQAKQPTYLASRGETTSLASSLPLLLPFLYFFSLILVFELASAVSGSHYYRLYCRSENVHWSGWLWIHYYRYLYICLVFFFFSCFSANEEVKMELGKPNFLTKLEDFVELVALSPGLLGL